MDIQKHLYCGIRYSRPVTQLFEKAILILIVGKTPHIVSANSPTVTDVNYLENPSNEIPDTNKKLPSFQAKCPALPTDRSQTYICCTK